ncbi:hypothetical protein K493DRAFT_335673 [Basidiobolus meristosporus CBS 931.73]|uniref:PH domain-containing protein n=1 Tax=Basidiobolus meristosporus CBS 931.73 TaxID=1314790 RepID=A0A1Y1YPG7_9FUNG|nr:hypothetical protein K493DRAFT_335673 [Basidiobolus meristosporus CBS 931.73]|eukprot:ORX99656.1 hypothetical protein K493DRAFT_335673 [Basidiobolus meristosporus CBS 931.73]
MYSAMPPHLHLVTETQRHATTFESSRGKKQPKSYKMFSPLNTFFRTQKDREELSSELENSAFDDTGELSGWYSQDEPSPSATKISHKRSEGNVDSYRRFKRLLRPIGFGIPELAIISPMNTYKEMCPAAEANRSSISCEKRGHFVNSPKYHIFSNLNIDFQPFRLVTFKIDEDNIWFKILDPVERRRLLLRIDSDAELEKTELDLFCQEEEKFEIFEDIQHVIVSDITIQSSKDRDIFQLTSRKGQFILEAGSHQEKREFINLLRFAIEAKLIPLVTNRMLILEGPCLLEQLFLLKFGKQQEMKEEDNALSKGNFIHKIGDVAGKCLDYGRKIHILQEMIGEKQRSLDDILDDLRELDEREKHLAESLRATGRSLELSQQLEDVEDSLEQSVARVGRALRRVHEKEDVIAGNQSILGSIKTTLDITELPEDTKSSWSSISFHPCLAYYCNNPDH